MALGGAGIRRHLLWVVAFLLSSLFQVHVVEGHARLVMPPSRASAWRFGWKTPINYNDHETNCGGRNYREVPPVGKCGICGDPLDGPRTHEVPSLFATGTIVKNYQPGQVMEAVVEVTAHHGGYFQFRLCKHETFDTDPDQECFDSNLLLTLDGKDKYYPTSRYRGYYTISLQLPPDLVCPNHCIFQWAYRTANHWGIDPDSHLGCLGCGPQENFKACSDITIGGKNVSAPF